MSFCLWLTGLPGSGKSTTLKNLSALLSAFGIEPVVLSLDHIRKIITPEPKYTDEERGIVYRALVMMAHLLIQEGGRHVIIDATGNRREFRDLARQFIPDFAEIYIECPLKTCEEREASRQNKPVEKDLYQRAIKGALAGGLPGVSAPYEAPINPEVRVRSDVLSPGESAERIMAYVRSRWAESLP
ncbi:MAG: adenylyl-sulfate kinase [Deltaproteobacteria bacterium]|nr:adenylyl-sulfate kinase [Deltaproteobacteria bacterium]